MSDPLPFTLVKTPRRDEAIAELLARFAEKNERGELRGIAIVALDHDLLVLKSYCSLIGVPSSVMIGAIELLKEYLIRQSHVEVDGLA